MEDSGVPKDLDEAYDDANSRAEAASGDEYDGSQDWEAVMAERENEKHNAIQAIIDITPSEVDQIDAIAEVRGWFRPEPDLNAYKSAKAYMNGTLDLPNTVSRLISPIDEAYSTANYGRAIHDAESTATNQRQYWAEEEGEEAAIERWGSPLRKDQLPELDEATEDEPTTEGLLWDLWYSILHVAKQTQYADVASQEKLVDLVDALKAHPNPPPPTHMTKALKNNWIWSSGTVWSTLSMLGPSARECWNDSPGCGSGFSVPEIHAWANLNAFIAAITHRDLADFWIYALWAMREALEDEHRNHDSSHVKATAVTMLDALVPAAAVWVLVMGQELYMKEDDMAPKSPRHGRPGAGGELWKGSDGFSRERWRFWRDQFGRLKVREGSRQETRDIADEAFQKMEEIERENDAL